MLSSTQSNNVKYQQKPLDPLENDTTRNSTAISSFTDQLLSSVTTAQKAAMIFTEPVEALTVIVCLLGIIANLVSIIVVVKMRLKMTTHLKLVINLCLSDALISLGNFSYYFTFIFFNWHDCIKTVERLGSDIAFFATLLNLLIMALDHYGAIIKPLHYRQKMTYVKGNCTVLIVWLVSLFGGLTEVIFAIVQRGSICTVITNGRHYIELAIILFIFMVLVVICLLYGRIYSRIRIVMPRRERARHHTDSGSIKALITTMLFVGTFIVFWTPFAVYTVFLHIKSKTHVMYIVLNFKKITVINNILYLVLLLNVIFDPMIYAVRLPKVKRGFIYLFSSSTRSSINRTDKN